MATDPSDFDDILRRFEELTPEQRAELLELLERKSCTSPNGNGETRSVLDAFLARGLVGSLMNAPHDASTNPKYMEGFGQDGQ